MFLKILGIIQEPTISEPINILVIALIALYFALYIGHKIYKWAKDRDERLWKLTEENIKLSKQIEKLTDEIINLTIQLIKPKDPVNLIDDHLGYPDVKFAIYCLSKKIEESDFFGDKDVNGRYNARKNIIIGIDRGGAIVGGLLAKNLGVAIKTLAINWADRLPPIIPAEEPDPLHRRTTSIILGDCLDNIDFKGVKNILLVDDTIRTGHAMIAAKSLVRDKLNKINKPFRFVCDNPDPGRTGGQNENMININIACILYIQTANPIIEVPEFCVYQTEKGKIWLLWDTTRPEMKIKGEEKKLFDEYYNHIPNGLLS